MRRHAVTPELVLDEEMFQLAEAALGQYAPELVLTWEAFTTRENWLLIPDVEHPEEPWYKAEYVAKQGPPYTQTVKLNVWRRPDLRKSGAPMPHSHPWPFRGHVLVGGYEEERYETSNPTLVDDPHSAHDLSGFAFTSGIVHQAGETNTIPLTTFHEVTRILEPGRTLSMMDCDLGKKEGWGYLDPDTGLYTPNKLSPTDERFNALFLDRNPHRR